MQTKQTNFLECKQSHCRKFYYGPEILRNYLYKIVEEPISMPENARLWLVRLQITEVNFSKLTDSN